MSRTMSAIACTGPDDGFRLADVPVPVPHEGFVRIKVLACGINPVDTGTPRWARQVDTSTTGGFVVPGLDVAGIVDSIGPGVTTWKIGDRVFGHGYRFRPWGGFAEYSLQPAACLIPIPEGLDPLAAAASPCAGWTAWRTLVDRLRIVAGESILIAGGAGGVGSFALQICRHLGLFPVIASCSDATAAHCRAMGATHTLDYASTDLPGQVRAITGGEGVRKGLDAGSGDSDIAVADSLGFEGEMVLLSRLGRPTAYRDAFARGLGIFQFSLGDAHAAGPEALSDLVRAGGEFTEHLALGHFEVPLNKVVDLGGLPTVLDEIRQRKLWGKAVLRVP